jgi:DNA polymerase III delta prime subunit
MTALPQSLPRKSSQLKNKNAASLVKFFESNTGVLYLYGETGSGKSYGVTLLAKEFGYETIYARSPFNEDVIRLISSSNLIIDKKLIVVECADDLGAKELSILASGNWGENRLILIGDAYPKDSPIRTKFKEHSYGFDAIKFYPFEINDIVNCLSLYAIELGTSVTYDTILAIAKRANGDMRAARYSLKSLIASGDEDSVENFLPITENAYMDKIHELFSKDKNTIAGVVKMFTPYISLMIIRENILQFCPDNMVFLELLMQFANLKEEHEDNIVDLAYLVGRENRSYQVAYYRKATPIGVPEIDEDCSDTKKILYYTAFEKWFNNGDSNG